jgi:DNA-binding FadR family transcriptional regulator
MTSLSKSQQVVLDLERRIFTGELRAGDRLPTEEELTLQLGVSRTVVRDAIRNLSTRHLVRVRHGFGMEVAPHTDLSFSHALADLLMRTDLTVGEVLDAREALDRQLAPLAARNATDEDVAEIEEQLERFAAAAAAGEAAVAQEAHLEIHLGLMHAMHIPALELLLKPLAEVIVLSSVPPSPDPARWEVDSHRPLLEALRMRDEQRLVQAVDDHFAVLRAEPYADFRAALFRELLDYQDLSTLRRLLTIRANHVEEGR